MRTLLLILSVLIATSREGFAHVDRVEQPKTLTVNFKTGESVTFTLANAGITAANIRVGKKLYSIPPTECAKFHDIHLQTVKLLWDSTSKAASIADYFYIQFEMGSETERKFGDLPLIEIIFRKGKFDRSVVTRKTAENIRISSPL